MILTLTLNPALDISGIVPSLIPNEKSYVSDEKRYPGGNGINSARIAHRLGSEVLASGFLGGPNGIEIDQLLTHEKMPHHFVSIEGQTRMNVTISLAKSHEQTRLSFPGPFIHKKEINNLLYFLQRSKPSLVLIGGSLPPGIGPATLKKIIKTFNEKDVPTFLDVPGKILKECISANPILVKPNLSEFQEMLGKKIFKKNEVIKAARKFSQFVPLQCISSVEGGALLIGKDFAFFGQIPKVKVHSSVGAGDSMVGAMAHVFMKEFQKINSKSAEKMLRTGLAASCATLVNKGLTMGSRASIKSFSPLIEMERID